MYYERKDLLEAVKKHLGVVDKKNVNPLLSHLKFHLNNRVLEISSSDSDLFLTSSITMFNNTSTMSFAVPAVLICDILRKITDKTVNIVNQSSSIVVQHVHGSFSLPTAELALWPKYDVATVENSIHIHSKKLLQILRLVRSCCLNDDSKPSLSGISLTAKESSLLVAATDGRSRFAYIKESIDTESDFSIVISKKAVEILTSLLMNFDDMVLLECMGSVVTFYCGKTSFTSKLVSEAFPNYTQILHNATHSLSVTTFNAKALLDSCERLSLMLDNSSKALSFSLSSSCVIETRNSQHGYASEKLVTDHKGDSQHVILNGSVLADMLKVFQSGQVSAFVHAHNTVSFRSSLFPELIYITTTMKNEAN